MRYSCEDAKSRKQRVIRARDRDTASHLNREPTLSSDRASQEEREINGEYVHICTEEEGARRSLAKPPLISQRCWPRSISRCSVLRASDDESEGKGIKRVQRSIPPNWRWLSAYYKQRHLLSLFKNATPT